MRLNCLVIAMSVSAYGFAQTHAADIPTKSQLALTFFEMQDVGGCGLAIVIQTPSGRTWLYDTGVAGGKEKPFDAGRDVIGPFLKQEGIQRIDGIVISHPHNDHYGGLPWLLEHFAVDRLVDSGYPPEPPYAKSRKQFVDRGGKYQVVVAGNRLALDEQLQGDVLAPPKGFFGEAHPGKRAKWDPPSHYLPNKNSLILRIRYGKITVLIPGDIQEQDQHEFVKEYFKPGELKATILSAPGHGLHADPQFAEAVRPEVVVVSCLRRYGGGQKAKAVYGKLEAQVYSTETHGRIQIVSDGQQYNVTTERSGE